MSGDKQLDPILIPASAHIFPPDVEARIQAIWRSARPGELMGITIGADEALVTVGDRISETVRIDGEDDR